MSLSMSWWVIHAHTLLLAQFMRTISQAVLQSVLRAVGPPPMRKVGQPSYDRSVSQSVEQTYRPSLIRPPLIRSSLIRPSLIRSSSDVNPLWSALALQGRGASCGGRQSADSEAKRCSHHHASSGLVMTHHSCGFNHYHCGFGQMFTWLCHLSNQLMFPYCPPEAIHFHRNKVLRHLVCLTLLLSLPLCMYGYMETTSSNVTLF